jgi:hypothetical protein
VPRAVTKQANAMLTAKHRTEVKAGLRFKCFTEHSANS